jgi:4-amino-4-deoxy-L-arabinose transferase-like glycosyltransferase
MRMDVAISPNRFIVVVLLLFFLLLLPVLPQVSTYHSDEQYYTDSAIYMVQHSDYLSPRLADGSLRAKKPILTYWFIIAGYGLFGINFFAARLPFMLAGCITIWLAYRMALLLFTEHRVAVLSAVILASNMQFIMLSLRATPDILQVLFMNVSLFGFIAVVFDSDGRLRNYLLMYFGAALVVLTKGLLGVVLIAFLAAGCCFSGEKARPPKRITHWTIMTLAAVVALWWYAYMYLQHGETALWRFYTDQIGGKIRGSNFYLLSNLKDYLWGVFRNFLPWSLILAVGYFGYRKTIHTAVRQHRKAAVFVGGWFALMLIIFIGSTDCRTRYLVPAYPLLAILISGLFWHIFEKSAVQMIWKWVCAAVLALLCAGGLVLLWFGSILQWQVLAAGLVLLVGSGATAWGFRKSRDNLPPVVLGLLLLTALAVARGLLLPTLEFGTSRSLAACLLTESNSGQKITVWSMRRANYLRQLYTLSQGRIRVRYFKRGSLPQHSDHRPLVVFCDEEKKSYPSDEYVIKVCGAVFRPPAFVAVWRAMLSRNRDAVLQSMQEPIYLARRKSAAYPRIP